MKIYKNVKSTARLIPEIEVNVDTVYVRSNITDISDKDNPNLKNIGQEIQYKKDHFIGLISERNRELEIELVEQNMETIQLIQTISNNNEIEQAEMLMELMGMISDLQGGA